jgi:dTDP-D-glucose 4,6-dehydratase
MKIIDTLLSLAKIAIKSKFFLPSFHATEKSVVIIGNGPSAKEYLDNFKFDASMPDGTPRKLLNSKRLFDMGWKPKIMLNDGLQSTYKWFAENLHLGLVRGYDK